MDGKELKSKISTEGALCLSDQCDLYSCVYEQSCFWEADLSGDFQALAPCPSELFSNHFASLYL